MREWILENQHNLTIGLFVFLFILIFFTCHSLFSYLRKNNVIEKKIKGFYEKTQADVEERSRLETIRKAESGNTDKITILSKLDTIIDYSNIKKYIPFLNSTTYIFIMVICSSIGLIIGTKFSGFGVGVFCGGIVIMIYIIILLLLSNINYKKVEQNVMRFINLVENYSKTNNDLISIMGKIYYYLDEPLRTHVEECYYLGLRTGDADFALENLQKNVQHGKFKEIIRNLIICSHYEANYEDVIEDSRDMLITYLAGKRERAEMARNARIELSILLGACMVVFFMIQSFLGTNILTLLQSNIIGNIILIYCAICILAVIFNIIFIGRQED
jgi:hypothetical protein